MNFATHFTPVCFEKELTDRLQEEAERQGASVNQLVVRAVTAHLDSLKQAAA